MRKQPNNYAFIDGQNLYHGTIDHLIGHRDRRVNRGWKLDYAKFRLYLKNKYSVSKAYFFIGQVPGNEALYGQLEEQGYILIFKPTMPYKVEGKEFLKGNVDADLVLYASAITYDDYDQAVIVSGDGDFLSLIQFLDERGKLKVILAPNQRYSSLLSGYASKISLINRLKGRLSY